MYIYNHVVTIGWEYTSGSWGQGVVHGGSEEARVAIVERFEHLADVLIDLGVVGWCLEGGVWRGGLAGG